MRDIFFVDPYSIVSYFDPDMFIIRVQGTDQNFPFSETASEALTKMPMHACLIWFGLQ